MQETTSTFTETEPRADRLDFVGLQVRDLSRSKDFYTQVLGFEAVPQGRPDAIIFRTQEGAAFAIRTPLVDLDAVPKLGWGVGVWVGTRDVEGLFARVQRLGAKVLRPPSDGPFGRFFMMIDPDGYQLTVHQVT